jgi:hypothetical protein
MPSTFQLRIARIAQQQYDKYHLMRESQPPLNGQIRSYWTDLGKSFPGVSTAWSAVFVSWCAKQAGATVAEFPFSSRHSDFIFKFIKNAKASSGVFRAHQIADYSPKVGDILHNNRNGHNFTYSFAEKNSQYESHTAIVIEVGADSKGQYLRTIGGNESDSVGMKEVRLTSKGRVVNPQGLYISVVETLL